MSELDRRELLARGGAGALALAFPAELVEVLERVGPSASVSKGALRELRRRVRGPVFLPGTPGYGRARLVYNTRFDGIRPPAVAQPLDSRDVQALVRWADRYRVTLVPRSGGHSYAGYSTSRRAVVVDLRRMRGIRLSGREATVQAGARLIDVYAALARRGATIPAGSCPSVGIAGLALGGGMGLAGRRFGLTCDNLRALTIVTADGRRREVDARRDEDLFWACRGGGGGNFGIVTGLTFRAHRARSASWFRVTWPSSSAGAAIAAWQRFAPDAPDALTSVLSLSSGPSVSAFGQFFGSPSALRRLIRPLTRAGGRASVGSSSYMAMMLRWAGCLDGGLSACRRSSRSSFYAKSDYVERLLSARGHAAMLGAVRSRGGASGALLLDAYGGAINRIEPEATAFVHRDQLFSIQYLSYGGRASRDWVRAAHRAMRPYVSGQAYQNYIDPDLRGWERAYYGRNHRRLQRVKQQYDPERRFRFAQGIRPG